MGLLLVLMFSLLKLSFGSRTYGSQGCVDQTGQIRSEGETWNVDGCRQCSCTNGNVICLKLHVVCPPKPHPNCIEIHGPCCPQWDCSMIGGCRDFQGMNREEGEVWYDPVTPCTVCSCHERIVECFTDNCNTGCTDHQGIPRSEGEIWPNPTDPCTICSCKDGMVVPFVRDCPPPPHIPCTRPPHPGQCCLDCNPSLGYYH